MQYSCARDHGTAGAKQQHYEPCDRETASGGGGQGIIFSASGAPPPPPGRRRPRRRHSAAARRSSTTVVATDVGNFRAMVQELTGFPPAAIFRPLPRRAHAAGGGGSPGVPAAAAVQPPAQYCATPGVFDGLADLGSPGFDAWPDLSFE